jgi:hypothetical protein
MKQNLAELPPISGRKQAATRRFSAFSVATKPLGEGREAAAEFLELLAWNAGQGSAEICVQAGRACRDEAGHIEIELAAGGSGKYPTCLLDQKRARGNVPWLGRVAPISVDLAGGDLGEVDRRRSAAARGPAVG